MKIYRVKEMFYSLQGEGAQTGRAAVFCRFSKCNLWTGREKDRAQAICDFCDTDFIGTDGKGGGQFTADQLGTSIEAHWPQRESGKPYVIFTGGEPLLQLDETLIDEMHRRGFEVAVETNGTRPLPKGIDWVCVSPKADAEVVVTQCDEVKLVYPQELALPERFKRLPAKHYFLSPRATPNLKPAQDIQLQNHIQQAIEYCLQHPQWRLTLQMHKHVGIE